MGTLRTGYTLPDAPDKPARRLGKPELEVGIRVERPFRYRSRFKTERSEVHPLFGEGCDSDSTVIYANCSQHRRQQIARALLACSKGIHRILERLELDPNLHGRRLDDFVRCTRSRLGLLPIVERS